MPEPPELRNDGVVAIIRWLDESATRLHEDVAVAASHGHAAQAQVETHLRLYEDAALLFRQAYPVGNSGFPPSRSTIPAEVTAPARVRSGVRFGRLAPPPSALGEV